VIARAFRWLAALVLGVLLGTAMAVSTSAAPAASTLTGYTYDGFHDVASRLEAVSERGPPVGCVLGVAQHAVDLGSRGASTRPQPASPRIDNDYDHTVQLMQATCGPSTTGASSGVREASLRALSGARCAAKAE
jgi:hypothetical protein